MIANVDLYSATQLLCFSIDYLCIGDFEVVKKAVYDARSKWYDIGVELKISVNTLDAINEDISNCSIGALYNAMLKEWLRRTQPRPTWKKLAAALRSPPVGFEYLADELPPHTT